MGSLCSRERKRLERALADAVNVEFLSSNPKFFRNAHGRYGVMVDAVELLCVTQARDALQRYYTANNIQKSARALTDNCAEVLPGHASHTKLKKK